MKKLSLFLVLLLTACQYGGQKPDFAPARKNAYSTIIGEVEAIYVMPMEKPFEARVDTGAMTSSIDAINIERFERDGQPYVAFDIVDKVNKTKHRFEKKVIRIVEITRTNEDEKRIVVEMDVNFAGKTFKSEFSLNDRSKFEYQVLIGRNILKGNFIVDVSVANTRY